MTGCLLPAVFAAAHGVGSPVVLPVLSQGVAAPAPPSETLKALPGVVADHEVGTPNFTVQWNAPDVDIAFAESVADHLEDAWAALVERDGWDPPMTSASHKLLVWLTPDLAAPGLATGEPTEAFPAGQPIIYLNPLMLTDGAYRQQVVHHEFVHTTQFHLRDWYGSDVSESWYWEASAEWLTEYVDPEANGQAWISAFYADSPGLAYNTTNGGHEYAMFLLNAYLDEHRGGLAGLQSVWLENEGLDWLTELERVYERSAPALWADFTGAYFAGQLSDAEFYARPEPVDSPGTIEGELGSMYIHLEATDGEVVLEDGEGALVRDGEWVSFSGEATIPDGEGPVVLVVTNPSPTPLPVAYEVRDVEDDPDTGHALDDTAVDEEDTGMTPANDSPPTESTSSPKESSSGCNAGAARLGGLWPLIVVALRRRYASRRECPPR